MRGRGRRQLPPHRPPVRLGEGQRRACMRVQRSVSWASWLLSSLRRSLLVSVVNLYLYCHTLYYHQWLRMYPIMLQSAYGRRHSNGLWICRMSSCPRHRECRTGVDRLPSPCTPCILVTSGTRAKRRIKSDKFKPQATILCTHRAMRLGYFQADELSNGIQTRRQKSLTARDDTPADFKG